MGMTLTPAAFTTYGGWGRTIYVKLDEEYEQRKKEEKAEGKSGWAAYRWKRDLLERMSIAIAKGTGRSSARTLRRAPSGPPPGRLRAPRSDILG